MSDIVLFEFNTHTVRVVMLDGEPWWIVNDICVVLGIRDSRVAVQRIADEDVCQARVLDARGVLQSVNVVNESGLYELVVRSDKESAREFRRWVTHEVLPQIRKTGAYVPETSPDELLVMLAQRNLENSKRIHALEDRQDALEARQDVHEHRTGWCTALAYAKRNNLPAHDSFTRKLSRKAGVIGRADGLQPAKVPDERYGEVNAWPEWAWNEAIRQLGVVS